MRPPTINGLVVALRFFFTVTVGQANMARHLTFVREPRKIPVVLSEEEIASLPAGSFLGGFRTTASVPAESSRAAVIRNPSQTRTLSLGDRTSAFAEWEAEAGTMMGV